MKAFLRIRLAEAQDVLDLDRFRPGVDKKSPRSHRILRLGPAWAPRCSYGDPLRKTGIWGTCLSLGRILTPAGPLCYGDVNQRTQEAGVF